MNINTIESINVIMAIMITSITGTISVMIDIIKSMTVTSAAMTGMITTSRKTTGAVVIKDGFARTSRDVLA